MIHVILKATGKSSILNRYINDNFDENISTTIGIEFGSKISKINEQTIKLQLWDSAGQENYKSITCSYFRK